MAKGDLFGRTIDREGKIDFLLRAKTKIVNKRKRAIIRFFGKINHSPIVGPLFARITRQVVGPALNSVKVEVNDYCNQSCKTCYMPKSESDISMEIIDSIVSDIRGHNIGFEIIGGEPLMRDDIFDIVHKAKHDGRCPKVSLYTNGTLATPEICRRLKESGLDAALVTLHSHLPEVHDSIAQNEGSWDSAIAGIGEFKAAGIKVYTATVVQKDNVEEIKETCNFVEEELKASAIFTKFIPEGPDSPYAITPKKWREVRSWLIHEQKRDHMKDVESFFSLTGSCPSGNYIVAVKADGTVQPCPFATGFTLGKMPEQGLWEIYENRFQIEKFLELKRIPNQCESCVLKHLCGGGCRSASFGVYDGLCGKDPNCGGPFSKVPDDEDIMDTLPIHF